MPEYFSPRSLELAGCDFPYNGRMHALEALEAQALHRDCDPSFCTTMRRADQILEPDAVVEMFSLRAHSPRTRL